MPDKKYNVLDTVFHEITTQGIKFSDKDKKLYNEHLKQVLDCIISRMKEDDVFKCLYRNNMYTGSSYENLRISKPDEFDINLIFVLPATCKIENEKKRQPGFVQVRISSLDESYIKKHLVDTPGLEKTLKSWIDTNGFLLRTNFQQWMQGVFSKALNIIKTTPLKDTVIKPSASGPAFTVYVSHPTLTEYSIDLVPVFEFSDENWPLPPVRKLPKGAVCKDWTVVPKPPPDVADPTYWRMSFYKQEKEIMNNLNGMKHSIKLMKLFREKQLWKYLSSYAIKTMFLWENERQTEEGFWKNGVGQLFIHMLQRLSERLSSGSLPFYWDAELDLLSKVKDDTRQNMVNRITKTLKEVNAHLHDNPQLIKKFFGYTTKESEETKSQLSKTKSCLHEGHLSNALPLISKANEIKKLPSSANNLVKWPNIVTHNLENFRLTKSLETPRKDVPKPKQQINSNVHCSFSYDNTSANNQRSQKMSDYDVEILLLILQQQREIKHSLQSICQQYVDVTKEVRELREENMHLRKLLQNYNEQRLVPPLAASVTVSPLASHSFKEQECTSRDSLLPAMQLKLSEEQNPSQSKPFALQKHTNVRDNQFSELLEGFSFGNTKLNASHQSSEDLISFHSDSY